MSTIFPYMSDPHTPQAERERLQDRWGYNPFAAGPAAPEPETGTLLPPQSEENKLEFLGTALDRPVPLAYGRHLVAGAPVFQHRLPASNRTILFIALGDGEWDSAEVVWVNGRSINLADGNRFHFHPGTDGEKGIEDAPATRNQQICSLFPSAFTGLTFSRTAYIALDLPDDPAAPGPGFDVRGIYKTRRVRIFDADGNQAGYAYSANPAWQLLDAFIALHLKPHGLAKEALTPAEKARIDFAGFQSAARFCDADIGGGVKRFESHVAFLDTADLGSIFETLRALCRGYLLEQDGKLGLFIDQPRRSVFTFSTDHILTSSLELPAKPLRSLANRLIIKARDLESGGGDATKDFAPWTKTLDDEPHQDRIGRILKKEFDLGANSRERAERVGRYWINRSLRLTEQARVRLTPEAGALMPGDRVSGPARIDYSRTRDWEVLDISDNPDGTRDAFLQEYDESIFSDAAESQQGVEETTIPTWARTVAAREGAAILTGTDVPGNSLGNDGDLYVRSDGHVWRKADGSWTDTGIDLTGAPGASVHRVPSWPPANGFGNNGDVAIADDGQFGEKVGGIWVRRGDLTGSTGPRGEGTALILNPGFEIVGKNWEHGDLALISQARNNVFITSDQHAVYGRTYLRIPFTTGSVSRCLNLEDNGTERLVEVQSGQDTIYMSAYITNPVGHGKFNVMLRRYDANKNFIQQHNIAQDNQRTKWGWRKLEGSFKILSNDQAVSAGQAAGHCQYVSLGFWIYDVSSSGRLAVDRVWAAKNEREADATYRHVNPQASVGTTGQANAGDSQNVYKDIPEMTRTVMVRGGRALGFFAGDLLMRNNQAIRTRMLIDGVEWPGSASRVSTNQGFTVNSSGNLAHPGPDSNAARSETHVHQEVFSNLSDGEHVFKVQSKIGNRNYSSTYKSFWILSRRYFDVVSLD